MYIFQILPHPSGFTLEGTEAELRGRVVSALGCLIHLHRPGRVSAPCSSLPRVTQEENLKPGGNNYKKT